MYPGRVCVCEREVSQSVSLCPPAHAAKVPSGFDGDGDRLTATTHAASCRHRRLVLVVVVAAAAAPVHERARNDGGDEFQGGPDWAPADRTMERKLGKMRRRQPFFVVPS
jgi:hypothetical protein